VDYKSTSSKAFNETGLPFPTGLWRAGQTAQALRSPDTFPNARADDVDSVLELTPLAHRGLFRLHSLLLNLRVESICTRAL
jgi:hypothetical protein